MFVVSMFSCHQVELCANTYAQMASERSTPQFLPAVTVPLKIGWLTPKEERRLCLPTIFRGFGCQLEIHLQLGSFQLPGFSPPPPESPTWRLKGLAESESDEEQAVAWSNSAGRWFSGGLVEKRHNLIKFDPGSDSRELRIARIPSIIHGSVKNGSLSLI